MDLNKKIVSYFVFSSFIIIVLTIFLIRAIILDSTSNTSGPGVTPIGNDTPRPIPNDNNVNDLPETNGDSIDGSCQEQTIEVTTMKYQETLDYPQIVNMSLSCKEVEEKINETIEKHIASSYSLHLQLEEEEKEARRIYEEQFDKPVPEEEEFMYNYEYTVRYEVKYKENRVLSLLVYDHTYAGGAHGSTNVSSFNFDLSTGAQILLGDVTKTPENLDKIKKYVFAELEKRPEVFQDTLKDVLIDNTRPFYFAANGIIIKFFESEIGPYAAGMPEVEVPNEVFQ
jgi:hypothetical protein